MTGKPKALGLLATKDEVKAYFVSEEKYRKTVINSLLGEYQTTSLQDVIISLAETYHPKYKIRKKRGTKTKWNDYLKALLSIEIAKLESKTIPKKTAIYNLIQNTSWSKLVKNSEDPQELLKKIEKEGRKTSIFKAMVKANLLSTLQKDQKNWQLMVESSINEALEK